MAKPIRPTVRSLPGTAYAPTTLEVFDFDWTLFRSPYPLPGQPRKRFLASHESLDPPLVPYRPGPDFWVERSTKAFRDAQRRQSSITAVITGRRVQMADRVRELLEQQVLVPDYTAFRSSSNQRDKDRVFFKRVSLLKILDLRPEITSVTVWEDDEAQIESFKDAVKRRGLRFKGILISEPGSPHI